VDVVQMTPNATFLAAIAGNLLAIAFVVMNTHRTLGGSSALREKR
jgi:hypothetical protein